MEISLGDITQAMLFTNQDGFPEPAFANYYKRLEAANLNDVILNNIEDSEQGIVWQTFAVLKQRLQMSDEAIKQNATRELAAILKYQRDKLVSALQKRDLRALLVFLDLNFHLRMPMVDYLSETQINENQINAIVSDVAQVIRAFYSQMNLPADAPYYEKDLLARHQQGIVNERISEVYHLLDSIERGRGIHITHHIVTLYRFLLEEAKEVFWDFLKQLKAPHMLVIATQWMNKEQLISIASLDSTNRWLQFEMLRQIFKKTEKEREELDEINLVANLLLRFYQADISLFNQAYIYFERSVGFHKALGRMLGSLTPQQIDLFVDDNILLRQYNHYFDQKNALLDEFLSIAGNDLKKTLLKRVYQKWEAFLDSLLKQGDFHTPGPEITDYANYALAFLSKFEDKPSVAELWQKTIADINRLDSYWYQNSSRRSTRFMLLFSKLYIYTLALGGDENKIDTDKKLELEVLFTDPILNKRYFLGIQSQHTFNLTELSQDIVNRFGIISLPLS